MENTVSMDEPIQGTILVVDDSPSNLTLLSRILSNSGYKVQLADNGQKAIDLALEISPDMILLDINMPVMDGYETCEKLKADQRTSDIPVIFISALSEIEDKLKAFQVGGADYIPKPIQIEEVLVRVSTHLANQRLRNQLQSANLELEERVKELTASQEQVQEREGELRAFINALPNLSFIYDEEGRCLEVLTGETELLSAKVDQMKGRLLKDVMPAKEAGLILSAIQRAIETRKTQIVEYKIPVLSGKEHWFEGRIASMGKFSDGHSRVVVIATDITDRVRLYQETKKLATQDPLTGCFNRRHFMILARQELQRVARYERPASLMMLDIDHFKKFNDQYGHPEGDQLLCALVNLCQKHLRNVDILARYGGEEFVILMPETDAVLIAGERLRKGIEKMQLDTAQGRRSVTVSIGAASVDRSGKQSLTVDELIKHADQALYEAKNAGRNCVRLWRDQEGSED